MEYQHTITLFGLRSKGQDSESCVYDLEVNAEINDVENINAGSYTHAPEYSGGSSVDAIYYKGVDVTDFVLSMIDEDEIIEAIECKGCELDSNRLRASLAA